MAQSAANLVEHVLPIVPLRQFVITFPFELRARLAYDGKLLGAVTRIAIDSVLGFYKRRMRDVDGVVGQSGAVTVDGARKARYPRAPENGYGNSRSWR